jgi:plastocyanin
MILNRSWQWACVVISSIGVFGCADGRSSFSPVSPSAANSQGVPRSNVGGGPVNYDHEPGHPPAPPPTDPGQAPPADPGQMPPSEVPPAPVPVPLNVNIISSFGTGAFMPNPIQAVAGDSIVWTNGDLITHTIVLDDGTMVGNLAPGQASPPIPLTNTTIGYHCTLHPSMVGQIVTAGAMPVPPGDMPPVPAPAPGPDPYGGGDEYDDGYDDYYYLGRN